MQPAAATPVEGGPSAAIADLVEKTTSIPYHRPATSRGDEVEGTRAACLGRSPLARTAMIFKCCSRRSPEYAIRPRTDGGQIVCPLCLAGHSISPPYHRRIYGAWIRCSCKLLKPSNDSALTTAAMKPSGANGTSPLLLWGRCVCRSRNYVSDDGRMDRQVRGELELF
ncbi:hypothetical protein C8R46DRAFT_1071596 [Mycena filopes]|nr:hypothetical protein C8R46DRAFT_1071596 [Mycena filopes]